ncbi:MAG: glutamate-5-semialdehyde dehydrogenase [Planctomycetaceae bacterium]|jgi:glutamate-5-semialdehyde dehydrogenase|nr:glutamate-5-semialdehyde dehydrogenase [Planctomycetaceae bacterium]
MSEVNIRDYCLGVGERAVSAAYEMSLVSGAVKNEWLRLSAELIESRAGYILDANRRDVEAATGLTEPEVDRLLLNRERLAGISGALREIEMFPDPVGGVIESSIRPNGLEVQKVRVPLGVIFFIYESRPNVTPDAAAICVKSGNAVILRGGKESINSNIAFVEVLSEAAAKAGLPADAVQLVRTTDREAVGEFLRMSDKITVTIPRGGEGLIRRVVSEAEMPVIKHFAGNCHVYIDKSADLDLAVSVTVNSKCQRLGVCNAAESLVIHSEVLGTVLPAVLGELWRRGVEVRGCGRTCEVFPQAVPATDVDFGMEYHDAIISVKVVDSIGEAIRHINFYSDKHTEAIITSDLAAAREFTSKVDSSAVVVNASTRFNDGGQIGLGAEIGISTDKLHARGPCGIKELTTYKYIIYGNGQIRNCNNSVE